MKPSELTAGVLAAGLLGSALPAFAGSGSGNVEIEWAGGYGQNGKLVFFYTTNHVGPQCNSYRQRWVLDSGTPQGKEQYALLLSAQLSGKPVVVAGTGDCTLWVDSEGVFTLGYVVTHP